MSEGYDFFAFSDFSGEGEDSEASCGLDFEEGDVSGRVG